MIVENTRLPSRQGLGVVEAGHVQICPIGMLVEVAKEEYIMNFSHRLRRVSFAAHSMINHARYTQPGINTMRTDTDLCRHR